MRFSPRLSLIAAPLVLALATTACGSSSAEDEVPSNYRIEQADRDDMPDEVQEILDSGRIMVGTILSTPPMGQRDEMTGRAEGFDAEIARIVAQRIFGNVGEGDNLFFVEPDPRDREGAIQDGTVDIVTAAFTITDERKQAVGFAGPYYVDGQSIMTLAEDPVDDMEGLAGKKVCAVENSTSYKNVGKQSPDADLTPATSWTECFDGLVSGTYDAVSTDGLILRGMSLANPGMFHVSETTFSDEPLGIGVPKGADGLREFINDTLELAFENGDWERAFDRTLAPAEVPLPETLPKVDRYEDTF
ncbi:MAG: transporter substrate-binding domain-containing protein [Stackebrandtia sp.]